MSAKTVEKRRKRSWPLYLILRKGRYKKLIISDEELSHLSSTTGKIKIQYISLKKRRKEAAAKDKLNVRCYGMDGKVLSRLNKTIFCIANG